MSENNTLEREDLLSQGLQYGYVDDQGKVWIKDSEYKKGKIIGHIEGSSEQEALAYYAQKYHELSRDIQELITEVQESDDATYLTGKIHYLRELVEKGESLGNHQILLEKLRGLHKLIDDQILSNTEHKRKLLKNLQVLSQSSDWKETSKAIQELSHEWNSIGLVAKEDKDELQKKFEKLRNTFFDNRSQFFQDLEAQKELNELLKDTIVRKAIRIKDSKDWKETNAEFQRLFDEWKSIGMVSSPEKNQELWEKFIEAKETFYANLRVHYDEIDKDREANTAKKELIIQKANEISTTDDWQNMHGAFDQLMNMWREVGPVVQGKSQELWDKFAAARKVFHDRKREFYKEMDAVREENTTIKEALTEKAKQLAQSETWKETTEAFNQLMEDWKKVGGVVSHKREQLWNEFIEARNTFFDRKSAHTSTIKEERKNNIVFKQSLIDKAKSLKESTDWKITTEEMKKLMDEWKNSGSLPENVSETMWAEFNEAREYFFEKKRSFFSEKDKLKEANLKLKEALCEKVEEIAQSKQFNEVHQAFQELIKEWKSIGQVPKDISDALWDRFKAPMDRFYESRKAYFARKDEQKVVQKEQWKDRSEKQVVRLESNIRTLLSSINSDKKEIQVYQEKINDLEDSPMGLMFKESHRRNIAEVESTIQEKLDAIEKTKAEIKDIQDQLKTEASKTPEE